MKAMAILLCLLAADGVAGADRQPVDSVDPFIGTGDLGLRWMLFPGAAMPFGMVNLSPDNIGNQKAPGRGGYDYNIGTISGFSHIHGWTMAGLQMMPTTGRLRVADGFPSRFRHETETASPGYYAVTLDDYRVRVELTATTRAGFQRYTFPKTDQARIMISLHVPGENLLLLKDARASKVSDTEIEGYVAPDQQPQVRSFSEVHPVLRRPVQQALCPHGRLGRNEDHRGRQGDRRIRRDRRLCLL